MQAHRKVLVTGGSRGIGQAIAQRFAREGHQVCVLAKHARTLAQCLNWRSEGGTALVGLTVDLEQPLTIAPAIEAGVQLLGGDLDVLVNNAGIFDMAPLEQVSLGFWQRFLAINLTAPMLVTQACLPYLRRSPAGHIVNISSIAGRQGFAENSTYCTTKYGLRGFGDALREELRPAGVRVSTVYPSATDTEIFDHVKGTWDRSSMQKPEAVADAVWSAHWGPGDRADIERS